MVPGRRANPPPKPAWANRPRGQSQSRILAPCRNCEGGGGARPPQGKMAVTQHGPANRQRYAWWLSQRAGRASPSTAGRQAWPDAASRVDGTCGHHQELHCAMRRQRWGTPLISRLGNKSDHAAGLASVLRWSRYVPLVRRSISCRGARCRNHLTCSARSAVVPSRCPSIESRHGRSEARPITAVTGAHATGLIPVQPCPGGTQMTAFLRLRKVLAPATVLRS